MRLPAMKQEDGADSVGEVGEQEGGDVVVVRVGGVEGGDADDEAEHDASPEDDAGEQHGGTVGGRPLLDVGEAGDGVAAGEAFVEAHGGEDAAKQRGQSGADEGEHKDARAGTRGGRGGSWRA